MSAEPLLRVVGLSKSYDSTNVVDDFSLEVFPGEVVTLLGPSGCGKSTTLRMVAGLEAPDAGEIWVRGRLVAAPARGVMVAPEARNLGLVFQSYAIWPHMSVFENIAYPLRLRRADKATIAARVGEVLRLVRLDGLAERRPTQLSGGQQQRVALARALVYEPDLLLLDEPLSNLDTVLRKEMRDQLRLIQGRLGTTLLYVTHDQEEAMSLSSRVIVMNRGRIEQAGSASDIYDRPATRFVQDFVGQTVWLKGELDGRGVRIGDCLIEVDAARGAGAVEVSVRVEDVVLSRDAEVGALPGEIVDIAYFGDHWECGVRVDGAYSQIVQVKTAKGGAFAAGDRVYLRIGSGTAALWPS